MEYIVTYFRTTEISNEKPSILIEIPRISIENLRFRWILGILNQKN